MTFRKIKVNSNEERMINDAVALSERKRGLITNSIELNSSIDPGPILQLFLLFAARNHIDSPHSQPQRHPISSQQTVDSESKPISLGHSRKYWSRIVVKSHVVSSEPADKLESKQWPFIVMPMLTVCSCEWQMKRIEWDLLNLPIPISVEYDRYVCARIIPWGSRWKCYTVQFIHWYSL